MTVFSKKLAGLALTLFFLHPALFGQVDSLRVHDSPYSVIYNHLYNLQKESYHPELAALSFQTDRETGTTLAIQLKQILDAKGLYVDLNRVPAQSGYRDSLTGEAIYFIDRNNPLIYVEQIDSAWYYSRTTVEAIPALHHKVFPFGTQIAVYFQAPVWQIKMFAIPLWKWLGLLLLLLTSAVFSRLIGWASNRTIAPFLQRHLELAPEVNNAILRLSRLLGLWVGLHLFWFIFPMFQLPVWANAVLVKSLGILSAFFLIFIVNQLVRVLFFKLRKIAGETNNTLDNQFLPLLRRLAFFLVWTLGIIYILDFLNVNVTALLAGISIGGLAIALAAQDTVKNFFGSIMIFVDKPFQIGDAIQFKDVGGVVEEVGIRSTRIRTFANSVTYVPNGMLADQIVDNLGLRVYRRFKTEIGITYDTPPVVIDLFVRGIRAILLQHTYTRKDVIEVHLNNFGSSSLNILLYTFFDVPDWGTELKSRHELMHAIMVLAGDLGVRFAFPTQTLHIEEFPGKGTTTPPPISDRDGEPALARSLEKIGVYFEESGKN